MARHDQPGGTSQDDAEDTSRSFAIFRQQIPKCAIFEFLTYVPKSVQLVSCNGKGCHWSCGAVPFTQTPGPESVETAHHRYDGDQIQERLRSIGQTLESFQPLTFCPYAVLCSIFRVLGNLKSLVITDSQVGNAARAFLPNPQALTKVRIILTAETKDAASYIFSAGVAIWKRSILKLRSHCKLHSSHEFWKGTKTGFRHCDGLT